jgi:hypothetical protein
LNQPERLSSELPFQLLVVIHLSRLVEKHTSPVASTLGCLPVEFLVIGHWLYLHCSVMDAISLVGRLINGWRGGLFPDISQTDPTSAHVALERVGAFWIPIQPVGWSDALQGKAIGDDGIQA